MWIVGVDSRVDKLCELSIFEFISKCLELRWIQFEQGYNTDSSEQTV